MGTKLILVVDDETSIRFGLSVVLACDEVEVLCAADKEEAKWLLREGRFDLLITDLHLTPTMRMEGLDLVMAARQKDPQMKVILMTGANSHEVEGEARRIGIADFWHKPISPGDATRRVRALGIPVDQAQDDSGSYAIQTP